MGRRAPMVVVLCILIASSSGCRREAILRPNWGGSAPCERRRSGFDSRHRLAPYAFRPLLLMFSFAHAGCRRPGLLRLFIKAPCRTSLQHRIPEGCRRAGILRCKRGPSGHTPCPLFAPSFSIERCRSAAILRLEHPDLSGRSLVQPQLRRKAGSSDNSGFTPIRPFILIRKMP